MLHVPFIRTKILRHVSSLSIIINEILLNPVEDMTLVQTTEEFWINDGMFDFNLHCFLNIGGNEISLVNGDSERSRELD